MFLLLVIVDSGALIPTKCHPQSVCDVSSAGHCRQWCFNSYKMSPSVCMCDVSSAGLVDSGALIPTKSHPQSVCDVSSAGHCRQWCFNSYKMSPSVCM